MLSVVQTEDVFNIIKSFKQMQQSEHCDILNAAGRILSEDIISDDFIPSFNRSAMDGYAVKASDTFGCSESIPAVLTMQGKIEMGMESCESLKPGHCFYIPTGGAVPDGADAIVMIEHSEDYGDGTIGILKPAASGLNYVFKGDDVKPGQIILHKHRRLCASDIGCLAALGVSKVPVLSKPVAGIISTGDELVDINEKPKDGQIRNVNSYTLAAIALEADCDVKNYGIIKDNEASISDAIELACSECDFVLISGGSSAGDKDNTAKIISEKGELLFHGIAVKPGKPTMLGRIQGKAVFGIAGHPGGAYFIANVFVKAFIAHISYQQIYKRTRKAALSEAVSSNHGRAQYLAVKLEENSQGLTAIPIISKSGLITSLAEADAYIFISRECEGLAKGSIVEVYDVI